MGDDIKIKIAKFLTWLGGIIILVWAFLKILGVIESPIWVQISPYIGIGVSIVSGAYWFGRKMESIDRRIESNSRKLDDVDKNVIELKEGFFRVKHIQQLCLNGKLRSSRFKRF